MSQLARKSLIVLVTENLTDFFRKSLLHWQIQKKIINNRLAHIHLKPVKKKSVLFELLDLVYILKIERTTKYLELGLSLYNSKNRSTMKVLRVERITLDKSSREKILNKLPKRSLTNCILEDYNHLVELSRIYETFMKKFNQLKPFTITSKFSRSPYGPVDFMTFSLENDSIVKKVKRKYGYETFKLKLSLRFGKLDKSGKFADIRNDYIFYMTFTTTMVEGIDPMVKAFVKVIRDTIKEEVRRISF